MERKIKFKVKISTLGSLFIISAIAIFTNYHVYDYMQKNKDRKLVDKFTNTNMVEENNNGNDDLTCDDSSTINTDNNKDSYIGILEIPKIDLKRVFYDINDERNDVNQNIQVIRNSTMPDIGQGILVIAGHSGNGINAFFKDLYKLENEDEIYIYYQGIKYTYKITDIHEEDKDGTIEITSNKSSLLVLTTCSQTDKSKQVVIMSKLINKAT